MEITARPGDNLYTSDGKRLGEVNDATIGRDGRVYVRVHRRLRSDFWIARGWIARRDGDAGLILDFGKRLVGRFRRSSPA